MKSHTKYQRPGPSSFRRFLSVFLYMYPCKTSDLWGGTSFDPRAIVSLNKLGRGPQDKATFLISKAWVL